MVIALITDFGSADYFIGALKGTILCINPNVTIIDITHSVPAQDIQSANFNLKACYKNFPAGTVFAAIVDPGVGSNRRAIIVETSTYKFVAPDNGILSFVFEDEDKFRVLEIENDEFCLTPISNTFHGRDIFAPVAAHLSNGIEPKLIGKEIKDFIRLEPSRPRSISNNKISAQIIHIDRFGNLVTNLKNEDVPERFKIVIGGREMTKVTNSYSEVEKGELLLIMGSSGYFEIVANLGSASKLLSAERNDWFLLEKL